MSLAPPPAPLRLASRPLLVAAGAVAVGTVVSRLMPGIPAGAFLWTVAGSAVCAGVYAVRARERMVTLRALALAGLVAVGLVGLGAARMAAFSAPRADSLGASAASASLQADALRGRDTDTAAPITVWARVDDVPVASPFSVRFTARADSATRGGAAAAVSGLVQVALRIPQAPAWGGPTPPAPVYPVLRIGDRVRLSGPLAALAPRRNPADPDFAALAAGRGIVGRMTIESESDVVFLGPATGLVDRFTFAVQRHVRRAVARHVPTAEATSVTLALLVADWSRIEDETVADFRDTGLMHLLSVSGLHLVFVGLALYGLLGPVLRRLRVPRRRAEWTRAALTLAVMLGYTLVAGAGVPVVRAFVMAAVLVVGRTMERRVDTLNGLGLAALLILLWQPTALFEVGCQLSFAAVGGLIACSPAIAARVPAAWTSGAVRKAVVGSLVASLVATLVTGPILLAWFGRLPLAGIVLNVPAIPLTSFALGSSLGAVATSGWWPWAADLFGAACALCVRGLLWTNTVGAGAGSGWTVDQVVTSPFTLGAMAAGIATLAFAARPAAVRRLSLAAVALLALGAWTSVARGDARPHLDAVFLDVGQGDACLLTLPNGRTVLIDAGERTPRRDEGERTVVPHLARMGVTSVDAVVATHPHADHIGGIDAVLRAVPVRMLVHNGQREGSEMWTATLRLADSLGVTSQPATAGDALRLDPTVRIRILSPSRLLSASGGANEASIVLLVEHGRTRWLFAGDAETAAEAELVARYATLLRADVVKVGHHGSRTSSSVPFVAAVSGVKPGASLLSGRGSGERVAVVSVARRNRHGLPDEEPVTRWLTAGADVVQTADDGAVWLRSDGARVERVDWRTSMP